MVKTIAAIAISAVSLVALLFNSQVELKNNESITQNLKSMEEFIGIVNQECTESLAVECVADIEVTVKACSKAFETEGKDVIADIKCAKDLLADKKVCWPCICYEAKQRHWKIIGC